MRARTIKCLLIFLLLISFFNTKLEAQTRKKVLIIDLPRLTFADLSRSYPALYEFAESGAVAMMALPMLEPVTLDKVYFGFNAGAPIRTSEESYQIFDVGENFGGVPAGVLYQSLTGSKAPAGGAVNIGLPKIVQINSTKTAAQNIGLFGKILRENSIKTGAIGNADADLINRAGAAMITDENGIISLGAVGQGSLMPDSEFPYGFRSDNEKIFNTWKDFQEKAQIIVVSLGDLERIERFSGYLSEKRLDFYRRQALQNYDRLFQRLLKECVFESTLVLIFSALSPKKDGSIEKLTPAIVKGPGFKPGLLYSRSTRKAGLISYYDLAPTILKFMDLKNYRYFNGRNLNSRPGAWREIAAEQPGLIVNHNVRWPLLTVYGYLLIGLVLLSIIGLIFPPRYPQFFKGVEYSYLFLLTVPAIFLIEAIINPLDWGSILAWTLGMASVVFFLTALSTKWDPFRILSWLSSFTIGVILIDGFLNGFFEFKSFLGYSAIAGARFYGIGNEYVGFLLGSYITAISLNFSKLGSLKNKFLWFAVFFLAIFLVHPSFGANIGGGITALFGLGITTFLWLGRPIKFKEIMVLFGAVFSLLIFLGLWEFYFTGNAMSHFGLMLNQIKMNGLKALAETINQKWDLNFRLIGYTPWAKVLIAIPLIVPFLYKRPPAVVDRLLKRYPEIIRGFLGLTFTAAIGLVLNDSGIVCAATMFIFGTIMCLLVIFKEWGHPGEMRQK